MEEFESDLRKLACRGPSEMIDARMVALFSGNRQAGRTVSLRKALLCAGLATAASFLLGVMATFAVVRGISGQPASLSHAQPNDAGKNGATADATQAQKKRNPPNALDFTYTLDEGLGRSAKTIIGKDLKL